MSLVKKSKKRQLNAFGNMVQSFRYVFHNLAQALNLFWPPISVAFSIYFLFVVIDKFLFKLTSANNSVIVYVVMYVVPIYLGGCVYLVSWQRNILIDESRNKFFNFSLKWREFKFFIVAAFLTKILFLPIFLLYFIGDRTEFLVKILLVFFAVTSIAVFSRLVMLLPIVSISDNVSLTKMFVWSWELTRGNAVKLYLSCWLLMCIVELPRRLFVVIFKDTEVSFTLSIVKIMISSCYSVFTMAIVVGFLCFSFSELRRDSD